MKAIKYLVMGVLMLGFGTQVNAQAQRPTSTQ